MKNHLNNFSQTTLEQNIRSIFDPMITEQTAEEGKQYCLHRDYKKQQLYAVPKEIETAVRRMGYTLKEGETGEFFGEKVRGMNRYEEMSKMTLSEGLVMDLWGNVAFSD